ncbi:NUDIX domain-containing protein [Micromonospora sonneratiae]|uniref:NUDIX domain-containing protein n=1 Tax=Micromonospora sonneratiae TaxID=1184706 RepID=A0ABW3YM11_9ACTN
MKLIDKLAWLRVEDGRILCARSYGNDVFYVPGGKREMGETDHQALSREIKEELCVDLVDGTIEFAKIFEAPAHRHAEGTIVRITCYRADYLGTIEAGSEIEEFAWLDYSVRDELTLGGQMIFDWLRANGEL